MGAFHAYDIRGIYNVDFDKDTAYKVGYFIPGLLGADKVLVGRDCRVSSPEVHDYLIKGIPDAGADVEGLPAPIGCAMIREVHVYGFAAQIAKSGQSAQHHGLGSALVERACAIASETGFDAINVISAVGTRDYYRKLGFTDNGLYQTRRLSLSR